MTKRVWVLLGMSEFFEVRMLSSLGPTPVRTPLVFRFESIQFLYRARVELSGHVFEFGDAGFEVGQCPFERLVLFLDTAHLARQVTRVRIHFGKELLALLL